MIPPEQYAEIRRLFFGEHWKVGTIATELGLHHDAVRNALETERLGPRARLLRTSKLDTFKPFILQTLERHPRLRSTRIFEMIKARGYHGSVVQLRRYVRSVRPGARAEAFLRLQTLPGEQGQVDWGCFGKMRIGHADRALSCFVLVLSWSRAFYARFFLDQRLESFLRGHVEAFEYFHGAPRVLLYDNLKSVVLERSGDHVRFHPRILELAGHYHFAPKPCAPYRGNEKGKVERTIQYLRHSFFAARRFASLDDLNAQLARWIADIADQRHVPTDPEKRTVENARAEETPNLLSLPEHPFPCDAVHPIASGKRPYVRFDLNDYSIPHALVRKHLTLVASERLLRILDGALVVAQHPRSYDRARVVEDPAHIEALADQKKHASELRGRDRLRALCPHVDGFLAALAARSENIGAQTRRLLALLDRYGARALDLAIAEAIQRGAVSAHSVAHLCDQRARASRTPPPLEVVLPNDPRVRDLRVVPHDLAHYDALATPDPKEKS